MHSDSNLFFCRAPRAHPRVRLICFPQAGGGVTVFHQWPDQLPEDVEVHAAQLPGRERRRHEPLATAMAPLADQFAGALLPLTDRPFALFGFSMGALVAFEVARRLARWAVAPIHLFVAARRAPHLGYAQSIYQLPDGEFLRALQVHYGALPEVVRETPELLEFFLPIIRADMTVIETYAYRPDTPLSCPITVYGGLQDTSTAWEHLAAWGEHGRLGAEIRMIDGDHFFPQSHRELLVADLAGRLRREPPVCV